MEMDSNNTVDFLPIDVDDWYYLAEGNQFIVLGYKHDDVVPNVASKSRMVLRIPKGIQQKSKIHTIRKAPSSTSIRSLWSRWFGSNNLANTVFYRLEIEVDQSTLRKIFEKIQCYRPEKRVTLHKLWLQEQSALRLDSAHSVAYVEPNYSYIPLAVSKNMLLENKCPTVCYDIKVKCGYKSCEPFHIDTKMLTLKDLLAKKRAQSMPPCYVADNLEFSGYHSIKWSSSKYEIMQHYKGWQSTNKYACGSGRELAVPTSTGCNWGEFTSISKYDPMDLCSRCGARIERALQCLIENPQNNLRMLVDGKTVTKNGGACDALHPYRCDWNFLSSQTMLSTLGLILEHETMLWKLQQLQSVDILFDIHPIYDRYVQLVVGEAAVSSVEEIEASIESKISSALFEGIGLGIEGSIGAELMTLELLHHWSVVCNFTYFLIHEDFNTISENDYNASKTYLETNEYVDCNGNSMCPYNFLVSLLNIANGLGTDDDVSVSECSFNWCKALSAHECHILFFLWLTALTAKDMSVMISMQARNSLPPNTRYNCLSLVDITPQTAVESGLITVSEDLHDYCFDYRLTLVDIELKPCSKLINKIGGNEESFILNVVHDVVSQ